MGVRDGGYLSFSEQKERPLLSEACTFDPVSGEYSPVFLLLETSPLSFTDFFLLEKRRPFSFFPSLFNQNRVSEVIMISCPAM